MKFEFIDFTEEATDDGPSVKGLVVPESSRAAVPDLAAAIEQLRTEQEELVVVATNHSMATLVRRVAHILAISQTDTARLIEAMVPRTITSPAAARQAQRNAEARQKLIEEFGLYDSDEVAELAGSTASNRSATASRWLAARKIFAVNHQGARRYPGFQFGSDGHPRQVIADVLEELEPYGLDGWEIALWFTAESGWLDDRRPVDLLTRDPVGVVDAARHSFDEVSA